MTQIVHSCTRRIYNNRLFLTIFCLGILSLWWLTVVTNVSNELKRIELPKGINKLAKIISRMQSIATTEQINYDDILRNTKLDEDIRSTIKDLIRREKNITKIYDLYIESRRNVVSEQIQKFQFHKSLPIRTYSDIIPESGGQPIRSLVLTTWRSGSTFLGDLLHTHPLSYYFYEPFMEYRYLQIRTTENSIAPLNKLKNILACNYTGLEHHIQFRRNTLDRIETHNSYMAEACELFPKHCLDKYLMSSLCALYPFQIAKIVRLRLRFINDLLLDESLNIRALYLIRDPRGILASRNQLGWCNSERDCNSPAAFCEDMVDNYNSFMSYKRLYPDKIKVIRYEDLVTNTTEKAKDIFDFLHLTYSPVIEEFISSHTTKDKGTSYSTYRDSVSAATSWMKKMNKELVFKIQKSCTKALNLWGYNIFHEGDDLKSFQPFKINFNENNL